jgi:hypothetical protein
MNGTTLTSSGASATSPRTGALRGLATSMAMAKPTSCGQQHHRPGLPLAHERNHDAGGGSVSYVSSGWNIAGIGDFNGDGKADILWRNSTTGQVYIWLMNGTTIDEQREPRQPVSSDWSIAGVGDFDGDGKSDILWQQQHHRAGLHLVHERDHDASSGSLGYVSSGLEHSGRGRLRWQRPSRHPVAQQHHGAGLHLADERDDVDEQREPRHPRRYLANSWT